MSRTVRQSIAIRDELRERITYDFEASEDGGTNVYFFLMSSSGALPDKADRWLMLNVKPGTLAIYPFNRSGLGYEPKYRGLHEIFVGGRRDGPYKNPADSHDVESILGSLPEGLEQDPLKGLGFAIENRFIADTLSHVAHGLLVFVGGGAEPPSLKDGIYVINELYLKQLVRGMRSIATRYQRQARTDKSLLVYNSLLATAAPEKFPEKKKKVSAEAIFELVKVGRVNAQIPRAAQRNMVDLVGDNAREIAKSQPETLYELAAKIEKATLQEMIRKFEVLLGQKLTETKWQAFFEANTFILSMAFAVPTIFVCETPYVHGKRINGRGGKYSDFLMRGQGTGNVAIIEIKAPDTEILSAKYRDDQAAPSRELVGAITQVLGQRLNLTTHWHSLKINDEGSLENSNLYSPQAVVLIGKLPSSKSDRQSFEAFRNVLRDVVVITFDELLLRLKYLNESLSTTRAQTQLSFSGLDGNAPRSMSPSDHEVGAADTPF